MDNLNKILCVDVCGIIEEYYDPIKAEVKYVKHPEVIRMLKYSIRRWERGRKNLVRGEVLNYAEYISHFDIPSFF